MTTYTIKHVPGYCGVDHFGGEIARYAALLGECKTLAAAKAAVKKARSMVNHPRAGEPRIDVVSSKGKITQWC